MQKFIGLVIFWAACSYIIYVTCYEWQVMLALTAAGTGGVIYGAK